MPYYLYKISTPDGLDLVKHLELLETFDVFRDAKARAKHLRAHAAAPDTDFSYKVMFAENQLFCRKPAVCRRTIARKA